MTGHVAAFIRCQEGNGLGDFVNRAEPLEGNTTRKRAGIWRAQSVDDIGQHAALDKAGMHRIDTHAKWGGFEGSRPGKAEHSVF